MPRKTGNGSVKPEQKAAQAAERQRLAAYKAWGGIVGSETAQPERDWSDVDPEYVFWLVKLATGHGGNVTFGLTKDGSSFVVTLYFHPNRDPRYYLCTDAGIEKFYRDVQEFAERLELL